MTSELIKKTRIISWNFDQKCRILNASNFLWAYKAFTSVISLNYIISHRLILLVDCCEITIVQNFCDGRQNSVSFGYRNLLKKHIYGVTFDYNNQLLSAVPKSAWTWKYKPTSKIISPSKIYIPGSFFVFNQEWSFTFSYFDRE